MTREEYTKQQVDRAKAEIERLRIEFGVSDEEMEALLESFAGIAKLKAPRARGIIKGVNDTIYLN